MKKTVKLLPILCAWIGLSQSGYAHTPEEKTVLDTFTWFNQIADIKRQPFNQEHIAAHFSKEAKMITNNKLVCEGIKQHLEHFLDLNRHYESMQVDINNIDMHNIGNRVYLDYTIHAVNIKHQAKKIHVMGYMEVKNNRISLFKGVIATEMV